MALSSTILFYLAIGAGVAAALWLRDDAPSASERAFQAATAILFWPLYVPLLLSRTSTSPREANPMLPQEQPRDRDEIAAAIAQAESELDAAVRNLDGWAEHVFEHEQSQLDELRLAWRAQADRIREIDRLLADQATSAPTRDGMTTATSDRVAKSEQARRENFDRLRQVRAQLHDDLLGTLAWVRELVTMIHLAKFTGAPASRAEELVAQIAAAVEGLSEVTHWREESLAETQA